MRFIASLLTLCVLATSLFAQTQNSKFYVIVAAYSAKQSAQLEVKKYKRRGYRNAKVLVSPDNKVYRVSVANYPSYDEASEAITKLVRKRSIPLDAWTTDNTKLAGFELGAKPQSDDRLELIQKLLEEGGAEAVSGSKVKQIDQRIDKMQALVAQLTSKLDRIEADFETVKQDHNKLVLGEGGGSLRARDAEIADIRRELNDLKAGNIQAFAQPQKPKEKPLEIIAPIIPEEKPEPTKSVPQKLEKKKVQKEEVQKKAEEKKKMEEEKKKEEVEKKKKQEELKKLEEEKKKKEKEKLKAEAEKKKQEEEKKKAEETKKKQEKSTPKPKPKKKNTGKKTLESFDYGNSEVKEGVKDAYNNIYLAFNESLSPKREYLKYDVDPNSADDQGKSEFFVEAKEYFKRYAKQDGATLAFLVEDFKVGRNAKKNGRNYGNARGFLKGYIYGRIDKIIKNKQMEDFTLFLDKLPIKMEVPKSVLKKFRKRDLTKLETTYMESFKDAFIAGYQRGYANNF